MEFTIDRSKWRCGGIGINGKGLGSVNLLNYQGYMCCLGQIAEQLGHQSLLNLAEPEHINEDNLKSDILIEVDDERGIKNSDLSNNAMLINDDSEINISEREKQLKERFKKDGIKLKFVGKSMKFKSY